MNIPAIFVDDIRSPAGQKPGATEMRERDGEICGFAFRCPCGCGGESWLPVNRVSDGWIWNGNRERPTLTPSILQIGFACKWHGYLTDGEYRPC